MKFEYLYETKSLKPYQREEKIFGQFKIYGIVADAITLKKLGITVKEIKEDEEKVKERWKND